MTALCDVLAKSLQNEKSPDFCPGILHVYKKFGVPTGNTNGFCFSNLSASEISNLLEVHPQIHKMYRRQYKTKPDLLEKRCSQNVCKIPLSRSEEFFSKSSADSNHTLAESLSNSKTSLARPSTANELLVVFNYLSRRHGAERFSACGRQFLLRGFGAPLRGPQDRYSKAFIRRHEIPAGTISDCRGFSHRQEQIQTLRGNEGRNVAIRIETKAFTDQRFKILANKLGIDRFSARARVEDIWEYCTQHGTTCLTEETINAIAECENFAKMLLNEEVDLAKRKKGKIYIRGTKGRIEWLASAREASKKGGEATKAKWQAARPSDHRPTPGLLLCSSMLGSSTTTYGDAFSEIWDLYGYKVDRGDAELRFQKFIKTWDDFENLKLAVTNYLADCKKTDRKLKHLSTFLGIDKNQRWREWVNPENSTPKKQPIQFHFDDTPTGGAA